MKKLFFLLVPIIIFSLSKGEEIKAYDDSTKAFNKSMLSEGEHEVIINGVKLWYLVRGTGPYLIVYPSSAGWGGDCSVYVEYLKPWEKYRTVIYLEPRGLGKSARLENMTEYSMNKYVEELENFRKELDINTFDLAGHCYAGMISMKYALKYQPHLNHIILISTFPKSNYPGYFKWLSERTGYENMVKRNEQIISEGLEGESKLKEEMKSWLAVTFKDYEKHKEKFEKIINNTIFSANPVKQFNEVDYKNYQILDSINLIETKTLVLYGEDDFPHAIQGSKDIKEKLVNSKIIEFDDCSHWVFIEQPEMFFAESFYFLNN